MPIRRILKVLREQYESLQKRFGNSTEKKDETTPVAAPEGSTDVPALTTDVAVPAEDPVIPTAA